MDSLFTRILADCRAHPAITFILLGFYGRWINGLATTFLLFYVLVFVMVGMYGMRTQQLIVVGLILIGAGTIAWERNQTWNMYSLR